jgi:uncharacterized membrane protein HdeD (DUF308 family)
MSDHREPGPLAFAPALLSPEQARRFRWLLIGRGVAAIVVGALIVAWPGLSLAAFARLIGLFFIVAGALRVVVGAVDSDLGASLRILNVICGLLLAVLGFASIRHPGLELLTIALLVGAAWLAEGILTLATLPKSDRGWWVFFGLLSVVAGVVPGAAPKTLIFPASGPASPMTQRMAVVFPEPLAPRKPMISPAATVKLNLLTVVVRPCLFSRSATVSRSMIGLPIGL